MSPAAPTISRRGLIGMVGGASLALLVANLGESIGGPLRRFAFLAPRGRVFGTGPNAFPVNKTADFVKVTKLASDPDWMLTVTGRARGSSRGAADGAAPAHVHDADRLCRGLVHDPGLDRRAPGRSRRSRRGLADGDPRGALATAAGPFRQAAYTSDQVRDDRALLALCVNGVDLSLDHGFPARIIIPALPGVHCTKWLASMRFLDA